MLSIAPAIHMFGDSHWLNLAFRTWPGQKSMNANALVRMRVRMLSYIPSDAFASLSAFSKISRILCVHVHIPDRILVPVSLIR